MYFEQDSSCAVDQEESFELDLNDDRLCMIDSDVITNLIDDFNMSSSHHDFIDNKSPTKSSSHLPNESELKGSYPSPTCNQNLKADNRIGCDNIKTIHNTSTNAPSLPNQLEPNFSSSLPNNIYFTNSSYCQIQNPSKYYLSSRNLNAELGWGCKSSRSCQSSDSDEFDKYLGQMVLQSQKKISKDLKIMIFDFFCDYLKRTHPELVKELKPLTRDEKRSVQIINKRLLHIKDFIYYSFTFENKETLVPIVEQANKFILKNHKRKGLKTANDNLKQIESAKLILSF